LEIVSQKFKKYYPRPQSKRNASQLRANGEGKERGKGEKSKGGREGMGGE